LAYMQVGLGSETLYERLEGNRFKCLSIKEDQMQRFHDFFEQRKMTIDLSIPYKGKYFTITEARTRNNDGSNSSLKVCPGGLSTNQMKRKLLRSVEAAQSRPFMSR